MTNICKNGLHAKRNTLLRKYLNSRKSMDEILKDRNINPTQFQKWLQADPLFRYHYIETRRLRALIQETNPTTEPGSLDHHLNAQAPPPEEGPAAAGTQNLDSTVGPAQSGTPRQPTPPAQSPLSERQWLRSVNGQEALEAYDQLVALNRQLERAAPADPGVPTSVEHVIHQEPVSGSTEPATVRTDNDDHR